MESKDIAPKSKIPSRYMIKQTIDEKKDFITLKELIRDSDMNEFKRYFKELEVGIIQ